MLSAEMRNTIGGKPLFGRTFTKDADGAGGNPGSTVLRMVGLFWKR